MYTRMFLYISIAVLTAVIAGTTKSELPMFWSVLFSATLSGFIAWRAFIDETPAAFNKAKKDEEELTALNEGPEIE